MLVRTCLVVFLVSAFTCVSVWADDAAQPTAKPAASAPEGMTPGAGVDFVMRHNLDADGKAQGAQCQGAQFKEGKEWKVSDFKGRGNVRVENGTAFLETGHDMTGIRWAGPLVRMNYQVTLEAMRVDGSDFFCGLTFPYKDDPCSLIVGGWGGTLVGISSLDYQDAYNNETARTMDFEKGRWYRIRLKVTNDKIEAWIDDKQIVDVTTTGRKIGIRWEVEPSVPFGIATWRTGGAIRNVQLEAMEKK